VDRVFQPNQSVVMTSVREYGTPLSLEPIERWTYVLSKDEFVVSMEFEHGVLVSIEQEGRPPAGTGSIENCRRSLHSNGDTAAEVLLRCGQPADSIRWLDKRCLTDMNGFSGHCMPAVHDRWTYNFGPQEFSSAPTEERFRATLGHFCRYSRRESKTNPKRHHLPHNAAHHPADVPAASLACC